MKSRLIIGCINEILRDFSISSVNLNFLCALSNRNRIITRLVNSRYFKKVKKTRTRDFEKNSFQIPYQNSRASLVCLLPVLFIFLEYRRSLVYIITCLCYKTTLLLDFLPIVYGLLHCYAFQLHKLDW